MANDIRLVLPLVLIQRNSSGAAEGDLVDEFIHLFGQSCRCPCPRDGDRSFASNIFN